MSTNKKKLEALLKLINSSTQEAVAEYEKAGGNVPSIDSVEPHPLDNPLADHTALNIAIRTLEGACAQLCTTLAPPAHTVMQFMVGYDSACARVAIRENITDILVDYPSGIHINDLSKIVKIDAGKLARVLRFLVTRGCYAEVEPDTFANNRLSLILHSENPVHYMLRLHIDTISKGATALYDTLKDPKTESSEDPGHAPFMYAIDKDISSGTFFDWLKHQDAPREIYHCAMKGLNHTMRSLAILTQFPFEKYFTIVDVGGGIGGFSLPLAKTHKHIKITHQDLPDVIVQARDAWEIDYPEAIEEKRVEFVELDFFTQVPVYGKDIYYLRNIIHDWPDHESVVILRNVRKALGPQSRVLIHEYIVHDLCRKQAEANGASFGMVVAPEPLLSNFGVGNMYTHQRDIAMWIAHNSKERTLQNFMEISTAAGLQLEKVWDVVDACILEFSAT